MIVSSEIRRAPYADILCMALGTGIFNHHIEHLLASVIRRIAFTSPRQLFETYAPSVTLKFLEDQRDISRIPASVLGYPSRRESASAVLRLGLPLALLDSEADQPELWRQFHHVTALVGISERDALKEIFSLRVALKICSAFDSYDSSDRSATLWQTIVDWPSDVPQNAPRGESVVRHLDSIVAHMLLAIGEVDMGPDGDLSRALRLSIPAVVSDVELLTKFSTKREAWIHRPSAPLYQARSTLQAIAWLEHNLKSSLPVPETLYHVLQRLFRAISSTPLMNEKIRALNAVCVLCALYSAVFQSSPALLRALLYGMAPVFAHARLSHRAQSIIHWACDIYGKVAKADPRLPELLVRVANTASIIGKELDAADATAGIAALQWIEGIGNQLQSVPELTTQIRSTRLLWPKMTDQHAQYGAAAYKDLIRILTDDGFTSNKFRLVQRLQQSLREKRGFRPPSSDFWSLKSCIPFDLSDADLDAYLDVLAAQISRVSTPKDGLGLRTLGQRHQSETRPSRKTNATFMLVLPHHAIISVLLDRMFHYEVTIRDLAYQSLRLVLSLPNNHLDTWKDPPEEILLLASRPVNLRLPEQTEVELLMASDEFINLSSDFSTWIKSTTQFLCSVLGILDSFYAQLYPIIQGDEQFATELFPVAVHELLRRQSDGATRSILSKFFTRLLQHSACSLLVLQSVVETCLHLRSFHHNPVDDTATGNNRWLDVDFALLATAATNCGAYTTALLFLELGREAAPVETGAYLSNQEAILYNIYSHIEEPDGFYGIKSHDVARFLVRRFRHENEWDKAFHFDGAAYEALPDTDLSKRAHSLGVVQALHSSGLNQLAVAMQQSSGSDSSLSSTDVELAWRTENWELPILEADSTPGASLFAALRSIHREGDSSAMEATVNEAIRREVSFFRDLGNESMTEVRSSIRRLLCLREAKNWILPPVQEALASNNWSSAMVIKWGRAPSDYQ